MYCNIITILIVLLPLVSCLPTRKFKKENDFTDQPNTNQPPFKYAVVNLRSTKNIKFYVPNTDNYPLDCNRISLQAIACQRRWKNESTSYDGTLLYQTFWESLQTPEKPLLNELFKDNFLLEPPGKLIHPIPVDKRSISYKCHLPLDKSSLHDTREACMKKKQTCREFALAGTEGGYIATTPLFSMNQWAKKLPGYSALINTLSFSTRGSPEWPFVMPCVATLGMTKAHDGNVFGLEYLYMPFDYLIFHRDDSLDFLPYKVITPAIFKNAAAVVPGLYLVRDGKYATNHRIFKNDIRLLGLKRSYRCFSKNGRSIFAVTNSNELLLAYVMNKDKDKNGATCEEIATFLIERFSVKNAIFFDGGGSAYLNVIHRQNEVFASLKFDDEKRPIPGVIAIDIPDATHIQFDSNIME
jgi:hypothetical protein